MRTSIKTTTISLRFLKSPSCIILQVEFHMDKRQECRLIDQYLPITLDHVTYPLCTTKQYLRNFRVHTRYANLSIFQPSAFISSLYSYDFELWRTFACKLVRICILTCTRPAGGRSDNEDPTTAMIIGSHLSPFRLQFRHFRVLCLYSTNSVVVLKKLFFESHGLRELSA